MIRLYTPAPVLAVSIAELKSLLRIEHDLEDALLATLLRTASEMVETFTGTIWLQQTFEQSWMNCPEVAFRLQRGPFVSLLQIMVGSNILAADQYALNVSAFDETTVTVFDAAEALVTVRFIAGAGLIWNDVPEAVRFGILRQAAHLYAHRDAANADAMPTAVQAILQPYRKVRLS